MFIGGAMYKKLQAGHFISRIVIGALRHIYHLMTQLAPARASWLKIRLFAYCNLYIPVKQEACQAKPAIKINAAQPTSAPRLLLDVSYIFVRDIETGIQRVVRNLCLEFLQARSNVVLVRSEFGELVTCNEYKCRLLGQKFDGNEYRISFVDGDTLFLLDASWDFVIDFEAIIKKARARQVQIIGIIHDLIPIMYPEMVQEKVVVKLFVCWHQMLLRSCDKIICVSKATADRVADYFSRMGFNNRLKLYDIVLGSNIEVKNKVDKNCVRGSLQRFVGENTILMVGTVEIRKGHLIALQAVNTILEQGKDVRLLIIGKKGWKCDEFLTALAANKFYGERIMWIDDASDSELVWAYQHATALLAASYDEGFGLPLVEASCYDVPIICSDIPVFHEVTGNKAVYFKRFDAADLTQVLLAWLGNPRQQRQERIATFSWQQTAQMVLDAIDGKSQAYEVLK